MTASELKNYGVEMNELFRKVNGNHPDTAKEAKKNSMAILRRHIGLLRMLRLPGRIKVEQRRVEAIPFTPPRGCNEEALRMLVYTFGAKAAMFCALSGLVGTEKAAAALKEIADTVTLPVASTELPLPEEFAACGDAFLAFKDYILEMFRVSKAAGIHDYNITVDNENVLQFDITYCLIYEYLCTVAPPEMCENNCYGDEVLFPGFCPKVGCRFSRKGNLATGYGCCHTRYERSEMEVNI